MDFKKLCLFFFVIACTYALTLRQLNREMLCMVNKERGKRGIPYLAYSNTLAKTALKHSKYQYAHKKMGHRESNRKYRTSKDRITRAGFKGKAFGENVSNNHKSVKGLMKAWMNSKGHKANILNRQFTHFGAGCKGRYCTQNFARSKNGRPKRLVKCPRI